MNDRGAPGIPNGWYAVAWSKDLGVGDVQRIRYFDEEMVLFRTRAGHARVLDAYCPHLGAHLGEGGRVQGESVRCPFHAWEFDGASGECSKIPYCARIPTRARVRTWEVRELNQMIFVWHHAEGKPPSWEVPAVPYYDDPDWSPARTFETVIPVHLQDMAENNLDPVHFEYVHNMSGIPDTERPTPAQIPMIKGFRAMPTRTLVMLVLAPRVILSIQTASMLYKTVINAIGSAANTGPRSP